MNTQWLIDSIVRQVTVLIAQLATAGGVRAPLAHLASSVFVELANELHSQGVSRKVSADMFGMALRAYLRKLRRLEESSTERGRSLWEVVLDFVSQRGSVSRDDVLERFRNDDPLQVRGVLHDMVESGMLFAAGSGSAILYRAASDEELSHLRMSAASTGLDELLWVLIYRGGPLSREELVERGPRDVTALDGALARLLAGGRVQQVGSAEAQRYVALHFHVPLGTEAGWEAAVFDHLQAMVQTISQRLSPSFSAASENDVVGGSTYTFDVWPGHPLEQEVNGCLGQLRARHSELRARVDEHNNLHGLPASYRQVVVYGGQCAFERETTGGES